MSYRGGQGAECGGGVGWYSRRREAYRRVAEQATDAAAELKEAALWTSNPEFGLIRVQGHPRVHPTEHSSLRSTLSTFVAAHDTPLPPPTPAP